MQVGDLVKLKVIGGLGIIVDKKIVVSNIAMGSATKFTVKCLDALVSGDYFPAFLEPIEPTDKNCPTKEQIKLDKQFSTSYTIKTTQTTETK